MSAPVLEDGKTEVIAELIRERVGPEGPKRTLVVGCGSGVEAAILARSLNTDVTGIDDGSQHGLQFSPAAAEWARLLAADATSLPFPNGRFDLVYSFHALEHIPSPNDALREMARVLTPGGRYFVGTPNRTRLVGYLGAKAGLTWSDKARLNLRCWWQMARGEFRNEVGAHAGFTREELRRMLIRAFGHAEDVSAEYYRRIYPRFVRPLQLVDMIGASRIVHPSVYFWGRSST